MHFGGKFFARQILEFAKVAERDGVGVATRVKVIIFGESAIFSQFNDFGVL